MRHIIVKMPLKNETFDGYSESEFCSYDFHIGNNENAIEFVKNWLYKEQMEEWPFEIISNTLLTGHDGDC